MEEKLINNLKDKIEKIVDLSDDISILNESSFSTEIEELKKFLKNKNMKNENNNKDFLINSQLLNIVYSTLYKISKKKEIKFFFTKESKIVYIAKKYLYTILFLIKGYRENNIPFQYTIKITEKNLKELLGYLEVDFNEFYLKLEKVGILYSYNQDIYIELYENRNIYSQDSFLFIDNFLNINFELREMKKLKKQQESINQIYKNLEKKLDNTNKTLKKEKIDLVAILGIFVAIFTLISLNFSFAKEITKDQITTFFILEGGLIFSLTFFMILLRVFIYDDKECLKFLIGGIIIMFILGIIIA